jgi:hypothetical protein
MIEHARHVPLRPIPWREREAAAAIEDIVADGLNISMPSDSGAGAAVGTVRGRTALPIRAGASQAEG